MRNADCGMDARALELIDRASDAVAARLGGLRRRVALVLGSGLGSLADAVQSAIRIPQPAIPGFPEPGAPGHRGDPAAGPREGVPLVVQSGRFHLYEGHTAELAALPTRVFARLGVNTLIVTNAAGGIRHTFRPPTLMLIADHINLMFRNPLVGPVVEGDQRFPDMSDPYDAALRASARAVALAEGIVLEEGVYAALLGPSFETPAEIRMLERLGADAGGVSPVPEGIAARAPGVRFPGFPSVTKAPAGRPGQSLSLHQGPHAHAPGAGPPGRRVHGGA